MEDGDSIMIDLKRCCILKRLQEWFSDAELQRILLEIDPLLLFNGDETEIARKAAKHEKVVIIDDDVTAAVPGKDLEGKHMSLFLVISAAGYIVTPYTILYGSPKVFADVRRKPIRCYKTGRGYMDTVTFYKIMKCLSHMWKLLESNTAWRESLQSSSWMVMFHVSQSKQLCS